MKRIKKFKSTGKLLAAVLAIIFVASACTSNEEEASAEVTTVPVSVAEVTREEIPVSMIFSGNVESEKTVNVSTKIMGRISQLDVEPGDFVRKGGLLVRIKDDNLKAQKSQMEANLSQARSALQNTETNYERLKALHKKESATQKEFDDISTQYDAAQANVQALRARLLEINDMLDYTVLEAPFDGYVVAKSAAEGDLAAPGQPLLTFEQQGEMKVAVSVPETSIHLFEVGDNAYIEIPAAGEAQIRGIVASVSPAGNRGSRQFDVEIRLTDDSTSDRLKSGMFARVSLENISDSVITIRKSALIQRGQLTGLYTISQNSEALLRWVRTGQDYEDRIEILSGLSEGEQYIVSSDGRLTEGQKIEIQ